MQRTKECILILRNEEYDDIYSCSCEKWMCFAGDQDKVYFQGEEIIGKAKNRICQFLKLYGKFGITLTHKILLYGVRSMKIWRGYEDYEVSS